MRFPNAGSPPVNSAGDSFSGKAQPSTREFEEDEIAREVYRYYCTAMDRKSTRYRLTDKRKRMLVRRAAELRRTVSQDKPGISAADVPAEVECLMKYAVDACARSPFHMGENEQERKYNDLEHIFRNYEVMERWLNQ